MTDEHSDGWSLVRTCTFLLNAGGKHSMVSMKAGGSTILSCCKGSEEPGFTGFPG